MNENSLDAVSIVPFIVPFKEHHRDDVARIHAEAFGVIGQTIDDTESFDASETFTRVALGSHEQVIGYVHGRTQDDTAYLGWLAIDESSRRQGVSRHLLRAFTDWSRAQKSKSITLDTRNRYKPALIMYLRAGYDIIGMLQSETGELIVRLSLKLS